MKSILTLVVSIMAVFKSCSPTVNPTLVETCSAEAVKNLVGQDASVLDSIRFSKPVRILKPNEMMTMDHNTSRTNFQLDSAGKIKRVWCG